MLNLVVKRTNETNTSNFNTSVADLGDSFRDSRLLEGGLEIKYGEQNITIGIPVTPSRKNTPTILNIFHQNGFTQTSEEITLGANAFGDSPEQRQATIIPAEFKTALT